MGYYNAADLPMYDFLAQQFCVCDRCYSSVPGATWPNRLYAISGKAAGSRDSKRVPLYANKSFVRHLDRAQVGWKFYSAWKPWSLAFSDDHYRSSELYEPFGSSGRRYGLSAMRWRAPCRLSAGSIRISSRMTTTRRPISAQVTALGAQVYQALARGPAWPRTLLILSYDEHGAFLTMCRPPPPPTTTPRFVSTACACPCCWCRR